MTTKTKLILGIFGAAMAGAALGLLLAPEKGTDMRKNISKKAGDWAGQLSDLFANAKNEINTLKKKGAKMASDVADRYAGTKENFS